MKKRLDVLLVERGLAPSRERAKAYIMEGKVFVDEQREDKPGSTFEETKKIEIHGKKLAYVSRGGLKLEKALKTFPIDLNGTVCMDIGASTGGFTDCMLQNGAAKLGHGVDYKYAHDYKNHYVKQQYLPYELEGEEFYHISDMGYEAKIKEHMKRIKKEADE